VPRTAVLTPAQRRVQRALERAPGTLTWIILAAPLVASLPFAAYVAFAIVVIDVYWFARSFLVVAGILRTYRKLRMTEAVDWWQRCLDLPTDPSRPDPRQVIHAALIPTYTEPYEILRATVKAIVDAHYPAENKVVAIITRETDRPGGVRPPAAGVLPHQGSAAAGHRGRQVGGDGLRRAGVEAGARPDGPGPQRRRHHRPRF